MFERPALANETRSEEIVHNVRELCKLDSTSVICRSSRFMPLLTPRCSMFLSRTVAAEVCMEAKVNEPAYSALKELDKTGDLLFELPCVLVILLVFHSSYPRQFTC